MKILFYNNSCSAGVTYNSHGVAVCKYQVDSTSHLSNDDSCRFSLSTRDWIGDQPLVEDPYEASHIDCKLSTIEGAGEGLYAKHDIPKG